MKWKRGQVLRTKYKVLMVLEQPHGIKGKFADAGITHYKVFYIRHPKKIYGVIGYVYQNNLEMDWYADNSGDFDEEINLIKVELL